MTTTAEFWQLVEKGMPVSGPPWLEALARAAKAEASFDLAAGREALDASRGASGEFAGVRELIDIRLVLREGHALSQVELGKRLDKLCAASLDNATLARAWHTQGVLRVRLNDFERAEIALLAALRLIEDSPSRLWILDSLGQAYQGQGAWSEARRLLKAVSQLKAKSGDWLGTAISAGNLALLEIGLGRNEAAEATVMAALTSVGNQLPALSRLRLHTLLLQSTLGTPREMLSAQALEVALADCGPGVHHLKGFAELALARAHSARAAHWLSCAEKDFSAPSDLALVRYWRLRLLPRASDEMKEVAETRALIKRAGGASEAELLTHLLFAERAQSNKEMQQHLDEAFEFAQRANNPLWVERVDRLYERLDPHGFSHRVTERFAGRGMADLEKTTIEDATSIFADLVGFTARSQELAPEEVMDTVRSLFELAVPLFVRFHVRPLQHQGDGLLAVCQGKGHAARGLGFARALVARTLRVTSVRQALGEKWGLTVRAGVASGPTVLGLLGSHYKMEFQAIGRTVNLAARLQGQAAPGEVCAANATVAAGSPETSVRESADLKGFANPEAFARIKVEQAE